MKAQGRKNWRGEGTPELVIHLDVDKEDSTGEGLKRPPDQGGPGG